MSGWWLIVILTSRIEVFPMLDRQDCLVEVAKLEAGERAHLHPSARRIVEHVDVQAFACVDDAFIEGLKKVTP